MDLSAATWWWIAAGVLVAAELTTGTFYLLMLALGCVAGALAAHAGAGGTAQIVAAALLGGGATAAWHFKRARSPRSAPADRNVDVNLDIGQSLQIDAWQPDGSAVVRHRGAAWTVRLADAAATPAPGPHLVVAVQGNQLRVAPAPAR
ncbi:MAG: NfeD family protein [Rubrivivax sp.]|nr:NfeD family protein [Rubrivivax sp.]